MIDLHCHILPAIDDGAANLQESLSLLRLAQEQGITHMVATPHIHPGYFDNTPEQIVQLTALLKAAAEQADINVKIACAAELRVCVELLPLLQQKTAPFIGYHQDKPLLLLELPHSHLPAGYENLLRFASKQGYAIMIAHPERNRELMAYPQKITQLQALGCLFQLTAASIVGAMGERCQEVAEYFLTQGVVTIVASDCHSLKRRPPLMDQAYAMVAEHFSAETAQRLFVTQPAALSAALFS